MTVGNRIKKARKDAGLTQKELGERLGLSFQAVAQWENDLRKPKMETVQRIADALEIDVNWLLNGYTLEDRDQAMKDYVARRFKEATTWKELKERIDMAFSMLNPTGQQVAVERVEELTKIPDYQAGKAAPGAATEPTDGKK